MVDKDFEKITYEDDSGNVKGTFETFHLSVQVPPHPLTRDMDKSNCNERNKKGQSSKYGFSFPAKNRTRYGKW